MHLLQYQKDVLNTIKDLISHKNNCILLSGKSGCGKTYTLRYMKKCFNDNQYSITLFDGDYLYDDREYYPLKKGLFSSDNSYSDLVVGGVSEASKEVPFAGGVISYIINYFSNRKVNKGRKFLNSEEQNILAKIKQKLKKGHNIFVFDNIHWWDRRSLQFLKLLLTNDSFFDLNKYQNLTLIFSITSNQEAIHSDILNEIISQIKYKKVLFPIISYNEFKEVIFNQTFQNFSDSQTNFLYSLIDGHLQVLYEVINEINNHNFDFNSNYENNKEYLSTIMEKRLKSLGASSDQIIKALEYASIIGITFSLFELKRTINANENEINCIIKQTTNLSITKNSNEADYIRFAHDIIRDIFKASVDKSHLEYYKTLSFCLKEIKPDQYLRRARYLVHSLEFDDATNVYLLEAIKQLRLYGAILETTEIEMKPLLNELQSNYLSLMQESYKLYSLKKYNDAYCKLNLILDILPSELLAERDILKIRCFSKTMASNDIQNHIEKYYSILNNSNFNNEKDVWERLSQALMIAFAHLGNITIARELESKVLQSLSSRINYDECATNRLNIVKRVSNSVHNIDTSSLFVKDAFDYFGNTSYGIINIRQFYMSLVNYSTILINNGKFEEAYKLTLSGFKIEHDNPDIDFPRIELLRNNYILSGYLSKNINEDDCIFLYKKILNSISNIISERLFYVSNLSIFFAIKGDPLCAYNTLNDEAKLHYKDDEKEGLYKYRVITNTAIYKYLIGEKETALEMLKGIEKLTNRLINGTYFSKKNELLIKLMKTGMVISGKEMLNALFDMVPKFQDNAWDYFGLGYAFMAVCNWDMSE